MVLEREKILLMCYIRYRGIEDECVLRLSAAMQSTRKGLLGTPRLAKPKASSKAPCMLFYSFFTPSLAS